MTDPDLQTETPPAAESPAASQLEILDRFEKYRRTWELELLISGAVIFALLGVPGRLEEWFFGLEVHVSRDQFMVIFFAYYYFQLIAYSLILSFCVNLVMRAYWIGLIGLNKVFPEGIRWSEVKDGPISQRVSRENPTLPQLIESTDRVSSLIFSTSFFLVILFVYSIVLVGGASLIAWVVSALVFGGAYLQRILTALLVALVLPAALCGLFDRALLKKPVEAWKGRWFERPVYRILKIFNWLSMRPLYAPIQMTLASNLRRQVTLPLFFFAFFGLIGFFMVSHFWKMSERLTVNGYTMFPDVAVERGVDHRHYESLRQDGKINRWAPTIQSDIIEEPFIKLFIPYSPFVHNRKLAKLCPEGEPIPEQKFFSRTKFNQRPPDESTDAALDCLGSLHDVSLNGDLLQPEYDFHTRSDNGVRGIVTYIPTDDLPKGRNALKIERAKIEEDEGGDKDEGDDKDDVDKKIVYFIPFWV